MKFLALDQIRQMVEMAEQARSGLSEYVGYEVAYDAIALQLLDEWIDRHTQQFPQPSQKMYLLWVSFLGEVLRRHHEGEWALLEDDEGGGMAILCPQSDGGRHIAKVSRQVRRRITDGMSASLSYFYTITSIELKATE